MGEDGHCKVKEVNNIPSTDGWVAKSSKDFFLAFIGLQSKESKDLG